MVADICYEYLPGAKRRKTDWFIPACLGGAIGKTCLTISTDNLNFSSLQMHGKSRKSHHDTTANAPVQSGAETNSLIHETTELIHWNDLLNDYKRMVVGNCEILFRDPLYIRRGNLLTFF